MVSYEKKDSYDINDLKKIMKILRSENGCPWDKVQNHETIREDFLEETCEVMEAIDKKDAALLKEELGDVLLQVVFHSEIESELGSFSFDDVCDGICRKLIIRHPHVFSDVTVSNIDESLANWDKIKKETKNQETYTDTLKAVARTFPALMRAQKVGKRAMRAGMDFADAKTALERLKSEISELEAAVESGETSKIEEEMGDVLFSCANVSRKCGIKAEEALERATDKFTDRFEKCEEECKKIGFDDMSKVLPSKLDEIWEDVKKYNN